MVKKMILVDMDGVLADLTEGLYRAFGIDVEDIDRTTLFKVYLAEYAEQGDFKWQPACKYLHNLIRVLKRFEDRANFGICTSSGMFYNPFAVKQQKLFWLERNAHFFRDKVFIATCSGKGKSEFASPNTFLIDDYAKNIEHFRNRGGQGFVYSDTSDSVLALEDALEEFINS